MLVYISLLFVILSLYTAISYNSGYGCYTGSTFSGALGYADDVTLIAPSLHSLSQMIKICDSYAIIWYYF